MISMPDPLALGPILYTKTVTDWVEETPFILEYIHTRLLQYMNGDWGDLDEDDWQMNIDTIQRKTPHGRLMGSYKIPDKRILWIITDGYGRQEEGIECCYTTILSPEDY